MGNKVQQKKKASDRIVAIACIAFAVIIVFALAFNAFKNSNLGMRLEVAAEKDGVEVNAAMMTFFYNNYLVEWYNDNANNLGYFGINPSYDLKLQKYGTGMETYFFGQYNGTWYDFFLGEVIKEVDMYVQYAVAANAAGIKLDSEDQAEIDKIMSDIKESLDHAGSSFSDQYGKGVKEKDVRECYELIQLAFKFYEHKIETLENALEDKDMEKYRDDNKAEFYKAEYISYEVTINSKDYKSDMEFESAKKIALMNAQQIAEQASLEEFIAKMEEIKSRPGHGDEEETTGKDSETATEKETESMTPEEELESKLDKYTQEISYQVSSDKTPNELGDWFFGKAPAQEGDVAIFVDGEKYGDETSTDDETITDDEETEAETEAVTEVEGKSATGTEKETEKEEETDKKKETKYTVAVYYVLSPSELDESLTKDAAFVIADDKAALEAFLAEFNGKKDHTRDDFEEIAEKHFEAIADAYDKEYEAAEKADKELPDAPVFSYDNVEAMPDEYFSKNYDKLNEWLDTGKLTDNTLSEIIEIVVEGTTGSDGKKSEDKTYYAVVYFEKYNDEAWYVQAQNSIVNDEFESWYKKLSPVQYSNYSISSINTITMIPTASHEGHDH